MDQFLLRSLLSGSGHPEVKLRAPARRVSARDALILAHQHDFEYGLDLRGRRVKWMRRAKPDPIWQPGYRQTDAPALQPSIEWMRRMGYAWISR